MANPRYSDYYDPYHHYSVDMGPPNPSYFPSREMYERALRDWHYYEQSARIGYQTQIVPNITKPAYLNTKLLLTKR